MPVYDYSYKVYSGPRLSAFWRWMAIPKFAYMEVIKLRIFTFALTVMAAHFLLRAVFVYLYVNADFLQLVGVPVGALPPIDAWFFKQTIDYEFSLAFILAFTLGANLIARDLKHGALVLYVSKPINRWEYFFGKLSVLFMPFMVMLWAMPMLLFVLQAAVAPANSAWRLNFWGQYAWIGGAITLYALAVSLTLSLIIMTASSLTKNGRAAGFAFVAFLIGSNMVALTTSEILNKPNLLAISPSNCAIVLGSHIFTNPVEAEALRIKDAVKEKMQKRITTEEKEEFGDLLNKLVVGLHEKDPLRRRLESANGALQANDYQSAVRIIERAASPPLPITKFWAWTSIFAYWALCGLILRRQINRGAQYGR